MLKPMEVGISLACFYPLEPEKAVKEAQKLGVRICEIFLNTYCELEIPYLKELRKACNAAGLKVYSIHPFTSAIENYLFFSPYPRRIADAKAFYARYAEAADILGASVVNIHADRGMGLESPDLFASCFQPLLDLQNKTGIIYALENIFYNSVNHPEFVRRLKRNLPEVRFTFDIKQAFKGSQDAYELADAMGEAIVNFHINDRDEDHICALPGRGNVDYMRIFSVLHKNGYAGPALIEVYRKNFGTAAELKESKRWLEEKILLAK